jgi:AcrR family transcriptional regulator
MNAAPTSPRRSREESRLQTRAHLLAAAKRLFVEKGFGATSLRDIAAEAGYTQGALFEFRQQGSAVRGIDAGALEGASHSHCAGAGRPVGFSGANIECAGDLGADARRRAGVVGAGRGIQASGPSQSPLCHGFLEALLNAHRDGLAYCITQIFARLEKVPPESPAVLAAAFMGLSQGLALQRPLLSEAPIGHMIMVFLRSLLAAAPPAK